MPPPASLILNSSPGRGHTTTISSSSSTTTTTKLTLSTRNFRFVSKVSGNAVLSAGAYSPSPISPGTDTHPSRSGWKSEMSCSLSSPPLAVSRPGDGSHAKLHKRAPSSSSLSGPTSPPPMHGVSHFSTPLATLEDSFANVAPAPAASSTVPKIKPYLRRLSAAKEDQGTIDLSRSRRENDRLSGLGIQDFGSTQSAVDVSLAHSRGGPQHGRTTSTGSQASIGSGRLAPTQPFHHPMAKTPRPYTPSTGISYASSLNDEAHEGDDVVEDGFRSGNPSRTRRSMSISSIPATNLTPLSRTASDLKLMCKLTSTSQSNLSIVSNQSDEKSSWSRKKRPRRNTELSQEYIPSPSSKTSLDKALSFVPRRSDPADPQSRDERILAARKKFEEKEANKDRKYEKVAYKRRESEAKQQERRRQKSDTPVLRQAHTDGTMEKQKRRKSSGAAIAGGVDDEKARMRKDDFRAKIYEDYRPANAATLPRHGTRPGESEKRQGGQKLPRFENTPRTARTSDGGWLRFSTWVQTRMLSCGGRG